MLFYSKNVCTRQAISSWNIRYFALWIFQGSNPQCMCSIKRLPFTENRNLAESLMNAIFYLFIQVWCRMMIIIVGSRDKRRKLRTTRLMAYGIFEIVNIFVCKPNEFFSFPYGLKIVDIQNLNQAPIKTFILSI